MSALLHRGESILGECDLLDRLVDGLASIERVIDGALQESTPGELGGHARRWCRPAMHGWKRLQARVHRLASCLQVVGAPDLEEDYNPSVLAPFLDWSSSRAHTASLWEAATYLAGSIYLSLSKQARLDRREQLYALVNDTCVWRLSVSLAISTFPPSSSSLNASHRTSSAQVANLRAGRQLRQVTN